MNHTCEFTWILSKSTKSASSSSSSPVKYVHLRVSNTKEEVNSDIAYREFQVQRIVTTSKDVLPSPHGNSNKLRVSTFSNEKGSAVVSGAEVRRIVQLQYISWSDHGVPSNCADLIAFVERMRNLREHSSSSCAVVHCSAGIGRTGVVILLDTAMDMIHANSPVRPIEMVRQMREYREMLIQTSVRYWKYLVFTKCLKVVILPQPSRFNSDSCARPF